MPRGKNKPNGLSLSAKAKVVSVARGSIFFMVVPDEGELRNCLRIDEVSVLPALEQDLYRAFFAEMHYVDPETDAIEAVGVVEGYVAWYSFGDDLRYAADAISADVEGLGASALQIRSWLAQSQDRLLDTVVLITLIRLEPEWRGHKLTSHLLSELKYMLRLGSTDTLFVLTPEPQRETGGFMPDGPERNAALRRVRKAYRAARFQRWRRTAQWWRFDVGNVNDED